MQRRPTNQDITWLLDINNNQQLDLDPPYQRRSVWTRKDKQFFLDTIFRNYPSPAIFLHKSIDEAGKVTYHVVDGKQRIQTILEFAGDKLRISSDYGDNRLSGKKWSDLRGEQELKQKFWNYQLAVEMIDIIDGAIVNAVFDRLNRNSRKLTAQELRHAKFEGWFISFVESEAEKEEWRTLGVATTARAKRMMDVQFISELLLVVLHGVTGFDQNALDEAYGKYEDPTESIPEWDPETAVSRFAETKMYILKMNDEKATVETHARGFGHFYTLWALVALYEKLPTPKKLAASYAAFMTKVQQLAAQEDLDAFLRKAKNSEYALPLAYFNNSRGASTDLGPREARFKAIMAALFGK